MNKVVVDKNQCRGVGEVVKNLSFRDSYYKREFLSYEADRETKLRSYLFASAICHQTHSLIFTKKNLKGWMCIEVVFTRLGEENSKLLDPDYIISESKDILLEKYKREFAEDSSSENCTLDRLDERIDFLKNIATVLVKKYDSKISNLIEVSGAYLFGDEGVYERLSKMEAFSDPYRKKSGLFVQSAVATGLIQAKDYDKSGSLIDYHIQRLLLRTGCIEVVDGDLKSKLQNKEKQDDDQALRTASMEAMKYIALLSQKKCHELDTIFWSIGRSCCNKKTLCHDKSCNKNPCSFESFVKISSHKSCIFDSVCLGKDNKKIRTYWQPMVKTHYY